MPLRAVGAHRQRCGGAVLSHAVHLLVAGLLTGVYGDGLAGAGMAAAAPGRWSPCRCRYGPSCWRPGCLYFHEQTAERDALVAEAAAYWARLVSLAPQADLGRPVEPPRTQALASQPASALEPGSGGRPVVQEAEALLSDLRGMSERLAGQLAVLEGHACRCIGAFRGFADAAATDSCGKAEAETLDEKGGGVLGACHL